MLDGGIGIVDSGIAVGVAVVVVVAVVLVVIVTIDMIKRVAIVPTTIISNSKKRSFYFVIRFCEKRTKSRI